MSKLWGSRGVDVAAISRYALLTVVAIGSMGPGYFMFIGALKTQSQILSSPFALPRPATLAGYAAAWSDQFPTWLVNSFIVTTMSVVLTVAIAALAGWGFAHYAFRGRENLLGVVVSLMVVPPVVLLIPLFQFGARLDWISTFRLVILIYVGLMLPFSVYMLTNFFRSIPTSILEAATIDGASAWATFRKIVVPLSGAPLATLAVVNLLWAWNELLLALVLLQSDSKKTLMIGITGFQSRYTLDIPTVMAGMSIATLPLIVAYLFGQRFFITGLTSGSTKGD